MRITTLLRPESVNSNYRARIPLLGVERAGHDVRIESAYSITQASRFADRDVVHFCRIWAEPFQRLARQLGQMGVGVTWDCDDDLTAIPRGNPGYRRTGGFRGQQVFADMTKMMRLAHVVTTPTQALADRFGAASGADVRVVENYLPPPLIAASRRPRRSNGKVVVGWVAGNEHQVDVEQLELRKLFTRLLERHPHVEVVSVGLRLGLRSERYRYVRAVELLELTDQSSQFDIAIAPLVDIPFNRGRSNVKVKEYAAAGTAWLASAVGPYLGLGEKQGGRVVANNRWEEELEELIFDHEGRRRLGEQGLEWARRQSIFSHALEWERIFAEAVERARARSLSVHA